jgi:hypothetical protein
MKPRKWVIIFAVFAFVCGSVVFKYLTFLENNRTIERLVGAAVSSSIGGEFSIGRMKVGFLSIYLENVTIAVATNYYNVAVRDIKISFSLLKLIRSRGNIGRSISKIIFLSPQLDIFLNNLRSMPSSETTAIGFPNALPKKNSDIYSIINNFPVDQFLIRKGVVRIFENEQKSFSLGEDLSGSLRDDAAGIYFELKVSFPFPIR